MFGFLFFALCASASAQLFSGRVTGTVLDPQEFPTLSQINTISTPGFATYHSLQALLRSNDFHGLTTQIAFTWSHNLDTASEVEDFFGTSGYVPQDSTNLKGDYGNSEFDQRRALLITYIYAIPSPKSGGALRLAARNWQISGTTTLRDGLAAPLLTFGDESGAGNFHERYNCVGPIHYQLKDFTQPYASVSSFSDPLPGTFRNCPRNPLVAPRFGFLGYLISKDVQIQRAAGIRIPYQLLQCIQSPELCRTGAGFEHDH